MKISSAKLVYFSPTGTTGKVVKSIALGMGVENCEVIDATVPDARRTALHISRDELLVIGVPVYMGRVPEVLGEWLNSIQADNSPAVCVVVYGNRVYDDALLELSNIVKDCGCVTVAGAAYIGEHSFSSDATPVAHGRPDEQDLSHAQEFGRRVRAKLDSVTDIAAAAVPGLPGVTPYRGETKLWDVDFIAVGDSCTQCGICAEQCPTGAIDPQGSARVDLEKCIICCACIKGCPQGARSMKDGPVKDASVRLNTLFSDPKQPEFFL